MILPNLTLFHIGEHMYSL